MKRTDPYSLRHRDQISATNADQAEFAAMRFGNTVASAGVYDERVASAMDDYAPGAIEGERWAQDDIAADTAVGSVQEELERRVSLLGADYPFALADGKLSYSASATLAYEFFLSACVSPSLTKGKFAQVPRQFERLASQLVGHWFGTSAVIHTGSPRDAAVGTAFKKAMLKVCAEFKEPNWQPQNHLPHAPDKGDHGVDFIACKAADTRPIGQLFLLAQCACGNDWTTKFSDLSLDKFTKWFHPFSAVPPVRAFATPHHVTEGWLQEASLEAGVVFDRTRLTILASKQELADVMTSFHSQLSELIEHIQDQSR